MRKIISLFQRNYKSDHLVRDEVVPGAEWVLAGEGIATIKWDGTAVMYDGRTWFRRYDVKKGRAEPPGFIPAQDPDSETGHWPGWVPITQGPEDQWLREAIEDRKRGNAILRRRGGLLHHAHNRGGGDVVRPGQSPGAGACVGAAKGEVAASAGRRGRAGGIGRRKASGGHGTGARP